MVRLYTSSILSTFEGMLISESVGRDVYRPGEGLGAQEGPEASW
jgi:hypothetical protein